MNIELDYSSTSKDPRYKQLTYEWQLLKEPLYWALIHRAHGCNGFIAGRLDNPETKVKLCSGCGRRVDRNLLKKLPFLIKMDLVNKSWRGQGNDDDDTGA